MNTVKPYVHIVDYWETDQMKVVHHSNYIKWMEEARLHFLREIGFPYRLIEESGYMLPVYKLDIKYKNPARFEEKIFIETTISRLTEVRMELLYNIVNENRIVLAEGKTVHPWTDVSMKVKKINRELLDKFQKWAINE